MKRALVMSFCAVSVAAMISSAALAQVNVAVNLTYDDPNDTSAGGSWQLVAKTTDASSVAGISAYLSGAGTSADFSDSNNAAAGVQDSADFSGTLNVVLGLDDTELPGGGNIGTGAGSNGDNGPDQFGNTAWDNSSLIASGAFTGTRPAFVSDLPNAGDTSAANLEDGAGGAVAGTVSLFVRGDSVSVDGLRPGDANRDGTVNGSDLAILSAPANWLNAATTWDTANFNSADGTNGSDLAILSSPANWLSSWTPPAVSAVPEPSTALLMIGAFSLVAAAGRRRRRV